MISQVRRTVKPMELSASQTIILALDPAIETGWCIGSLDDHEPRLGTLDLSSQRERGRGFMFEYFRRWLLKTIKSKNVTHVIFESPILTKFHNINMTRIAQGIDAHIEAAIETHNDAVNFKVIISEASPGQLKKALTGNGKAKKDEMMRMAWARGRDPANNNEADAFAAWLYVVGELDAKELEKFDPINHCLLYTSPSPRDRTRSRMPSSA